MGGRDGATQGKWPMGGCVGGCMMGDWMSEWTINAKKSQLRHCREHARQISSHEGVNSGPAINKVDTVPLYMPASTEISQKPRSGNDYTAY